MPTFIQAILLGAERLNAPPSPPHPALAGAWTQLDWSGAKETALLEACALIGSARGAGALAGGPLPTPDIAGDETQPLASPRAIAILRQLFAEEWRPLLPEWLALCARHKMRVPPFFLRTLFEIIAAPEDRTLLLETIGERGRWLARQNPNWGWVLTALPLPDASVWETGTEDERLSFLKHLRSAESSRATEMLDKTWGDETPDFRVRALELLLPRLSLPDEPLLTRALADRRKDVRLSAQGMLARLANSALAGRMRVRAESMLTFQRGLLTKKLEVNLPSAFDPTWKADAIEEKPPAGIGEKAHWTQQVLRLVPMAHWGDKFGLTVPALVALASKSNDWGDLLLGAWYQAACLHRDSEAAEALIRPILTRPKALPPGTSPQSAATALLAACHDADRWRIVTSEPDIAWAALPLLAGTPSMADGRALFEHLWRALRDGFNPGGSPVAVVAARRIPPELHDEASRRLARDNGLSKPAETFLRALELRSELHAAFSTVHPPRNP